MADPTEPFWNPERIAELERLAPHHSGTQIAARLGCTRSAVIGKAARLGLRIRAGEFIPQRDMARPSPNGPARAISGGMESEVRSLYSDGKSDREIARLIGVSNRTVGAWRQRNGIPSHGRSGFARVKITPERAVKPDGDGRPNEARRVALVASADDRADALEARFADGYRGQKGRLSLIDLRYGVCRFPIVMPDGQTRYCGLGAIEGASYCREHRARCSAAGRFVEAREAAE